MQMHNLTFENGNYLHTYQLYMYLNRYIIHNMSTSARLYHPLQASINQVSTKLQT